MEPILLRVGIEYPILYKDLNGNERTFDGSDIFDLTLLPLDIALKDGRPLSPISKEIIDYLYNHIRDAYKNKMKQGVWRAPKDWVESLDFPKGFKFRFIGYNYKDPQYSGQKRISASWDRELSEHLRLELNYQLGLYKSIQNHNKMNNKLNDSSANNLISQIHVLTESMANLFNSQSKDENLHLITDLRKIASDYTTELKVVIAELTEAKKPDAEQQKLDLGEHAPIMDQPAPAQEVTGKASEKSTEAPKKGSKDVKAEKTQKQSHVDSDKKQSSGASTETNTTASNVENQSSVKAEETKVTEESTPVIEVTAAESAFRLTIDKAVEILNTEKTKTDFKKEERNVIKDMLKKIADNTKLAFTVFEGDKEVTKEVPKSNNALDRLVNLTRDMAKLEIRKGLLAAQTPAETEDLSKEAIIAAAEEAAANGKDIVDESEGHATDKVEVVKEEAKEQDIVDEAAQAIKEVQKLGEKKSAEPTATQKTAPAASISKEKSTQAAVTDTKTATPVKEGKIATLDNGITAAQLYKEAENLDEYNKYLLNDIRYADAQGKIEGQDFEEYARTMLKDARNSDPEWQSTKNLKPGMIKSLKIVKDETFYSIVGGNAPEGVNLEKTNVPLFNADISNYVAKLLATEPFVKAKTTLVKAKAA